MALVEPVYIKGRAEITAYLVECPGCKGLHALNVYNRDKPIWVFNGDEDKPTFSPSIVAKHEGQVCHSFIKEGKWEFLADSTHALRGKTVPMIEVM